LPWIYSGAIIWRRDSKPAVEHLAVALARWTIMAIPDNRDANVSRFPINIDGNSPRSTVNSRCINPPKEMNGLRINFNFHYI